MSEREQSLAKLAADVPASAAAGRGRKRVLVVEDDAVMRLLLMSKLRAAGLEVDVASNGNLALKKLAGGQFDAIFLNPVLPDFQGVEVIKEARQDPKFASRPIYICTSALPASVSAGQATRA
ncbi:MAG TPA: response regulator, partial [Candidatus Binatia bacterium]|nr:response regulator [Candidatus Binatia bacterium]